MKRLHIDFCPRLVSVAVINTVTNIDMGLELGLSGKVLAQQGQGPRFNSQIVKTNEIKTKSDLEKKGIISTYTSRSALHRIESKQKAKAGTWKLELKEKPRRNKERCLLACFCIPLRTPCSGVAPPTVTSQVKWTKTNLNC